MNQSDTHNQPVTDNRHQFPLEQPIKNSSEDLLGRAGFSQSLAESIEGQEKGSESLVIALYGTWGSGKSSIKNMVLEALRQHPDTCPEIVEFNPWQWSGHENLTQAYFDDVGAVLGRKKSDRSAKLAAKWREYGATLKASSSVFASLRYLVISLLSIIVFLGFGSNFLESETVKTGYIVIAIAAIFAVLLLSIGKTFDSMANALDMKLIAHHESLSELKQGLIVLLGKMNSNILVVIDDVDRLSAEEIRQLFQLIKVNADFPNLIYLLFFQKDIVEASLREVSPEIEGHGKSYLEKIVRVGINIPKIERTQIEKILIRRLDEVFKDEVLMQRFDRERWGSIFKSEILPYFTDLRKVYRFLGTLSFHISLFKGASNFEVNPIDLVCIETLRIFEPKIYNLLPDNKSLLTNYYENSDQMMVGISTRLAASMGVEDEKDIWRGRVEEIIDKNEGNREIVTPLLKHLFPPIERLFHGPEYGGESSAEWERDLRVCHPAFFDRYFQLTIPFGDLPQAEFDLIINRISDRESLVKMFHTLNDRELLDVAFSRLEAYREEISLDNAEPFVTAIFDIGEELPSPKDIFDPGASVNAVRILHFYLLREQNVIYRFKIIRDAIACTSGVYIPVKFVFDEEKIIRGQESGTSLIDEMQLGVLKYFCIRKLRNAATSGVLIDHSKLVFLLYRWLDWGDQAEIRTWIGGELFEADERVLHFLRGFSYIRADGNLGIDTAEVEKFISLDDLATRVEKIKGESLEKQEQLTLRAFRSSN